MMLSYESDVSLFLSVFILIHQTSGRPLAWGPSWQTDTLRDWWEELKRIKTTVLFIHHITVLALFTTNNMFFFPPPLYSVNIWTKWQLTSFPCLGWGTQDVQDDLAPEVYTVWVNWQINCNVRSKQKLHSNGSCTIILMVGTLKYTYHYLYTSKLWN